MPYIAKEDIHLDEQGKPCEPDHPNVATLLARKGTRLKDTVIEKLGLGKHPALKQVTPGQPEDLSDPADPNREQGSDFYELTGQEPPVPEGEAAPKQPARGAKAPGVPEPEPEPEPKVTAKRA